MNKKKQARIRRATRTRIKIREQGVPRLCVHKSPRHMYAQIIDADNAQTLLSVSTLDKSLRSKFGGNTQAATEVGKLVAEKAQKLGIESVAFDRSGFKYHGRVKALADGAREAGLKL